MAAIDTHLGSGSLSPKLRLVLSTLTIVASVSGCADRLMANPVDGGRPRDASANLDSDVPFPTESGPFTHEVGPDGVITTRVDATSYSDWRHLDLQTGLYVEPEDPTNAENWDLGFRRFQIKTNGGVSGRGGAQVARLEDVDFDALTQAPEEGWGVDRTHPENPAATPVNAFNGSDDATDDWYEYAVMGHTLTARDLTYAIGSRGRFYKVRFESYYDEAGSPANLRFRWAPIDPPASALPDAGVVLPPDGGVGEPDSGVMVPPDALTVDASDSAAWIYVRLGAGRVTIGDPGTDTGWDLAFRRAEIRTNSGTSGPGLGGARRDESGAAFESMAAASTFGFVEDAIQPPVEPGGTPTSGNAELVWYTRAPGTSRLTPKDEHYLIRTADGDYAKLRVWQWRDGVFEVSFEAVARDVEVRELTLDASNEFAFAYLNLRDGVIVDILDPTDGILWDVGFSRRAGRTSSGPSGSGEGGAIELAVSSLGEVGELPLGGYVEDVDVGGRGENAALGNFTEIDDETGAAVARDVVFAVRTADGHLAAIEVRSYTEGLIELSVAYAGPGRRTLN